MDIDIKSKFMPPHAHIKDKGDSMQKICVIGLGYIGLPTALLFANHGYEVIGVDVDIKRVETINKGKLPFDEPGLQALLTEAKNFQTFVASTKPEHADVFIIAVPTPLNKETRLADLHYVIAASESIAPHIKRGNTVIIESTVPPGTIEKCVIPILEGKKNGKYNTLKANKEILVAHCPERAIPGNTLSEMIHNDRIIGGIDALSAIRGKEIYQNFVKGEIHTTSLKVAEMVKLMENTSRDINIALANEFAEIADEAGIDIWEAIELANKHPRVNILKPGPGVGGHCIAVDPWFLTENTTKSRIINLSREINDGMPVYVLQQVKDMLKEVPYPDKKITVFGVAYKGNIDDTRETPALKFILLAEKEGYDVKIYDPHVMNGQFEHPLDPLPTAVQDSDCIVVLTDHREFADLPVKEIHSLMRTNNIFDARNCLDHKKWDETGFKVRVLGKN